MDVKPEISDEEAIDRLADESGLAIAIVDGLSREVSTSNNNSICRNLNPSGEFSPDCAKFCGKALEKAVEAGGTIGFECHAGLDSRALPFKRSGKQLAAIIGRTFVKAENYRKATERAITGDWSEYPPSQFFENILLTGSMDTLDKTAKKAAKILTESQTKETVREIETPKPVENETKTEPVHEQPKKAAEEITNLVEKFNREVRNKQPATEPATRPIAEPKAKPASQLVAEPKAKPLEKRTLEARAWRSFFGSLLKMDYALACSSILEFLAHQYNFSTLIWLDEQNNRFENTTAFGDLKDRKVRLGLASDDPRLINASQNEMPLELSERAKGPEGTRTMNLFPIGVGGDISAAVAVLDPINDTDAKKQIARICHSIAPQLEILRLRNEVATGESLTRAVRRFSEGVKSIDSDDFWIKLTQNAAEMLRAERASLMILDERSDRLEIKAMIGAKNDAAADEDAGARVARIVLKKNEAVVIADVTRTGLPTAPPERAYKTASFISCPINIGGRTIGVMNFTDRACGEAFDKRSLELFQAIAPQLAVAIDRATLKEKAGEFEQLSVTDALTGLLNRRYIEERLMEEVKRSNRHGFPMSFMMLDVDQFKSYNDQFGHPAGDEALKIVAHVMKETLRGADVAARFGGEEFSILLPQTTGEEAAAIAERIRSNIEEAKFPHRRVTMSIGVASCSADLCVSADLISAADKALYEAKRQGRNRVLIYENMNTAANGK